MLHAFDTPGAPPTAERQDWLRLLARAPLEVLERTLGAAAAAEPQWLRRPETGLMMVQGRAGGTGERFNLGEVTVTRCALRAPGATADAPVGVAWVLGRSHRQARLAALADAQLQDPAHGGRLQRELLAPVRAHLDHQRAARHARAQSTRVDFFTVARESAAGAATPEDA